MLHCSFSRSALVLECYATLLRFLSILPFFIDICAAGASIASAVIARAALRAVLRLRIAVADALLCWTLLARLL